MPAQGAWLKAVCLRAGACLSRQPDALCPIRSHLSQRLDVGASPWTVTASELSDLLRGGEGVGTVVGCKPEG